MKTEADKAYLAGLIDGEGHIGITTAMQQKNGEAWRTHCLIVTVANTHLETLAWVKSLWQGTLVIRQQAKGRLRIGNLRWSSRQAVGILEDVQPYSRIKAAQIGLALQFARLITDRPHATKYISEDEWDLREELRLAIRQINRPDDTLKKTPYPIYRDTRKCAICGEEFQRHGTSRLYCSSQCAHKAAWQHHKAQQLEAGLSILAPTNNPVSLCRE